MPYILSIKGFRTIEIHKKLLKYLRLLPPFFLSVVPCPLVSSSSVFAPMVRSGRSREVALVRVVLLIECLVILKVQDFGVWVFPILSKEEEREKRVLGL